MQLLAPLASGIAGAAAGTVDIYKRGTSARATVYQNFDASGPFPSASITLDSNGGVTAYVNEPVDCFVKNTLGATVRSFTIGGGAPAVEVISQSFTGVDYNSGQSAVSKPATLAALMDLWKTTNGSPDWKVLVNGADTPISTALGGLAGLFYNVKAPAYGAKGDGTTDDATAIDAAATAAALTGGIVFFPPGTYRRTTTFAVPANVDLLGCGPGASFIRLDATNADVMSYANTTTKEWQSIRGLRIGNNQANAANKCGIRLSGAAVVHAVDCYIGDSNTKGGVWLTNAGAVAHVSDCTVENATGGNGHIDGSTGKTLIVLACRFVMGTSLAANLVVRGATAHSVIAFCDFEFGTVTSGTPSAVATQNGARTLILGNDFQAGGGATVVGINYATVKQTLEYGNTFGAGVQAYTYAPTIPGASQDGAVLGSRTSREEVLATDANVTLNADQYGCSRLKRTGTAAQTVTVQDPICSDQRYTLTVHQQNAGASGTITVQQQVGGVSSGVKGLASFTVNGNSRSTYTFVSASDESGGALNWVLTGSTLNYT